MLADSGATHLFHHAAGPLDAEKEKREGHNDDSGGQADAAVGEGKVGVGSCNYHVDEHGGDGEEGGEEESGHARGDAHEEGLEPTEVTERDAE